jgi:hypothetical protein
VPTTTYNSRCTSTSRSDWDETTTRCKATIGLHDSHAHQPIVHQENYPLVGLRCSTPKADTDTTMSARPAGRNGNRHRKTSAVIGTLRVLIRRRRKIRAWKMSRRGRHRSRKRMGDGRARAYRGRKGNVWTCRAIRRQLWAQRAGCSREITARCASGRRDWAGDDEHISVRWAGSLAKY